MVFDLSAGLYWRPDEGGLLFGMSNPAEPPGENRSVDLGYLARMRTRLEILVPITAGLGLRRLWAATIDYTPDHLPIIGPAADRDGPLAGVTVASAAGAGMMWGPGVARAAADVALTGGSDVVDTTRLGLDRFDEQGTAAAADGALPFPDWRRGAHRLLRALTSAKEARDHDSALPAPRSSLPPLAGDWRLGAAE